MRSRLRLLCLSKQSLALQSIGQFSSGFSRFSGHSLEPLVEGYAVLSSNTFGRHEGLLIRLSRDKRARPARDCR
jgi:hypothetical protein